MSTEQVLWARLPEWVRMWSPWWLRHVLAAEREAHNRTMQELREVEHWVRMLRAEGPDR